MNTSRVLTALWLSSIVTACGNAGSSGDGADAAGARPDVAGPDAPQPVAPLRVKALGVQGFALEYGDEMVMTAPLFTRQSTFEVTLNLPITPDTAAITAGLAGLPLDHLRAIVSGHAHYDHLLDVPPVLVSAPGAAVYTNLTGRNIFAALAPDRPAGCTNAAGTPTIPRARVVAMDDALASHVDYTNCPEQRPIGAPMTGTWITAPGGHVRMMAFCSMHPAQVGPYHFGEGAINQEQCELPSAASEWLEGQTLAFLIDFLDDGGHPVHRVFYQDAPTNAPIGLVPAAILADKPVDLALLCVGSNDAVDNEPTAIIGNLDPRYVVSGHWEDFFQPASAPPKVLPLLDVNKYVTRAEAALAAPPAEPIEIDGIDEMQRHVLAQPGMQLVVPPAP